MSQTQPTENRPPLKDPAPPTANSKGSPIWKQFICGAGAASMAVCFSNPFDVIKTRMQLQGELTSSASEAGRSAAARNVLRNPIQALFVVARLEGLKGLQRGLKSAIGHQVIMNGIRIGSYNAITSAMSSPDDAQHTFMLLRLATGFATGFLGNMIASPFYLMKIRFQSYSPTQKTAFGTQHHYSGVLDAVRKIWNEGATNSTSGFRRVMAGIRSLYQGAIAGSTRVGAAGAVQLTTYDCSKKTAS